MQSPDRTAADPQLPRLVAEFYRGVERQRRRDAETVAGLVRALKAGRAGELLELLRVVVRAEIQGNSHDHDHHA